MNKTIKFLVEKKDDNKRVDLILSQNINFITRTYIKKLIENSQLKINNYTTPTYLYKAGVIGLKIGENKKALNFFESIKADFPKSTEAKNIDVFIGKARAVIK